MSELPTAKSEWVVHIVVNGVSRRVERTRNYDSGFGFGKTIITIWYEDCGDRPLSLQKGDEVLKSEGKLPKFYEVS